MMSTVNVALSFVPSVLSFANSLLIEISALKKSSLLVTVMPVTGPAIVVVPSAVTLPVYDAGGDENATDGGLLYPIPPVLRLTLLTAPELIVRVEPDNVPYAIGLVIGLIVMLFVIDELDNSGGDCVLGPEVCGDYYNP